MLFLQSLISVALLASTVSAFYPYTPGWMCTLDDACVPTKRGVDTGPDLSMRVVQRLPKNELPRDVQVRQAVKMLTKKYQKASGEQVGEQVEERGHAAKRANSFNIVTAATPSQSNSAGVDQDGTDYSYFVEVLVGSANTPIYMLLDTGASSSWIMGPSCTSDSCQLHNSFGPADSTTFKDLGTTFSINYGSGQVSGTMGQDTLSFAGIKLTTSFGIATTASSDFSHFPMDGILGLSLAQTDTPHFWQSLTASKAVKANIMGLSINRNADGPNNGEVNFGAPDTTRYSGSLNYYPVATNSPGDWALVTANVGFGTSQVDIQRIAYIDTGTTFIFGPPADVKELHALLPGASSTDDSTWTVPCGTTVSATITFGSNTYTISPKDWISPKVNGVCTSNIYGVSVVDPNSWLIGDVFLKNVYAVFDYDQSRIGFAQEGSTIATSSSSSPPSSTSGLTSPTGALSSSAASSAKPSPQPSTTVSSMKSVASSTGALSPSAISFPASAATSTGVLTPSGSSSGSASAITTKVPASGPSATATTGPDGHTTPVTVESPAAVTSPTSAVTPVNSGATKFPHHFSTSLFALGTVVVLVLV